MASDQDFDDFTVSVEQRPVMGVTTGEIPQKLVELLEQHVPHALKDPSFEISISAKDAAQAKRLAGYARAWGARQEPKVRITKLPNRRDMPDSIARLAVMLESDMPAESRPGRKPAK